MIAALISKHHYTPDEVGELTPYQAAMLLEDALEIQRLWEWRKATFRVRELMAQTGVYGGPGTRGS